MKAREARNPSRRSFLRGRVNEMSSRTMRPPGAQADFSCLCDGCGDCVMACPNGIIVCSVSNGPEVHFGNGACTFCQECVRACPTGALVAMEHPAWDWRAAVNTSCLSLNGVSCRACDDACDERAIGFRLMTGGRAAPEIDLSRCTGCGACAHVCPSSSIDFNIPQPTQEVPA